MKTVKNVLPKAAIIFLIFTVLCGVVYTGVVTGIAQLIFPDKANGSIIEIDGKKYGCELLGQQYTDEVHMWGRIMNDYGHIDDETPSFAISLLKEYRNYGIGTELMKTMLHELRDCGYKQSSLAVQKQNYAVRMYKKVGFQIVDENEEEYIMVCRL